jgi:hypothetical protein
MGAWEGIPMVSMTVKYLTALFMHLCHTERINVRWKTMFEIQIKTIEKIGRKADGRKELLKHLKGERMTIWEAVSAKCYECTRYYTNR